MLPSKPTFLVLFCLLSIDLSNAAKLSITIETVYSLLKGNVPSFIETGTIRQKLIFEEIIQMFNSQLNESDLFTLFKGQYGKVYPTAEDESAAKEHFLRRVKRIRENNLQYILGHSQHLLTLNAQSDQQFVSLQSAGNWPPVATSIYQNYTMFEQTVPVSQTLPPVVNQSSCDLSVYFTVARLVEGAITRKGVQSVSVSVQQMIDCPDDGNQTEQPACSSSSYERILDYVKEKGLTSWQNYPFSGLTLQCQLAKENETVAQIAAYHRVPVADEWALLKALEKYGPIAVKINFNEDLAHYKRGVYANGCADEGVHLGVLLVGFGDGFWILKNQWSKLYGEEGYFRIKRSSGNLCGIASEAYYVEI